MPSALPAPRFFSCRCFQARARSLTRRNPQAASPNAHLRWAFGEAACGFLRVSERARAWKQRQEKKRGAGKALGIPAAKLARAGDHLWRQPEDFGEGGLLAGQA